MTPSEDDDKKSSSSSTALLLFLVFFSLLLAFNASSEFCSEKENPDETRELTRDVKRSRRVPSVFDLKRPSHSGVCRCCRRCRCCCCSWWCHVICFDATLLLRVDSHSSRFNTALRVRFVQIVHTLYIRASFSKQRNATVRLVVF